MAEITRRLTSIAYILIVVFAILFILYGPEQTFSKIKEIGSGISKFVKIGQPEETTPTETTAPHDIEAAFDALNRILNKWEKEPAERCLIKYPELPSFERDCRIALKQESEYNRLRTEIQCPNEKQQYRVAKSTDPESRPDLLPCIVGGKTKDDSGTEQIVASNFFHNWIDKKRPENPYESKIFTETWITGKEELQTFDKTYDLEDEGLKDSTGEISYLYKAGPQQICFFTTNQIINHDVDGIDDDYVKDMANYVPFCKEKVIK